MNRWLIGMVGCGLLLSASGLALSPSALGQQATDPIPPTDRQVVDQLGDLNHLPDGQWRVHPGDVPHGESTDLDDSTWPIANHEASSNDALWFRQSIEVPKLLHGYDLTGARIWFAFKASASSELTQIVYFNGRRVAMGESLEPIVLFDHAKPGDRVLVAVKVVAAAGSVRFDNSTASIDFASNRPNPEDAHDEFLAASLLVPSLSKNVPADLATLWKAIGEVDMKALDAGDQQAFDNSLTSSLSTLQPLKPLLQQVTAHLTGNSHIDAAWLWPRSETVDVVKRTFSTALQLMNEYPTYTYTQSAAQYNAWLAEKYPDLNSAIDQRIHEGRWEVLGGMWVEPDLNIPDGESTARSILIGKRWFKQHYGVDVRIGWNPDSFGYNWQLPQIYKKSGIDFFVTQKMSWNDTNKLPLKLFWWESPDGSKVLTYFPRGYVNTHMDPARIATDFVAARTAAPGMTEMMDLYGVGDHGGGPTRAMLDQTLHWMQPDKIAPKMEFGTALSYFNTIDKQIAPISKTWDYRTIAQGYEYPPQPPAGEISIPTWKDELYLEYHRGVFTTQATMKRNLRESPVWTLNAEKYASLAWLDGDAYPQAELTSAWKKITFNGFHDLAAGSGIGVIYKDSQRDFDQVRLATNEISARALNTLASNVDTRTVEGVPIMVFNPLVWNRSDDVTVDVQMPNPTADVFVLDASGSAVPSQILSKDAKTHPFHLLIEARNVPSMGYEVLRVVAGKHIAPSGLHVTGTTMENTVLRVTVDPKTGCITSLYNKKAAFETLAPGACGNELQAFQDKPTKYDAWNIDPGTLDKPPTLLKNADSVVVVDNGPMRGVIRVTRTWQNSKFIQEIVLDANSDEATVVNDIDWHETHILLKSAFALSATAPFATYEIPYGTIQRPTTRKNSWEQGRFEVPAQYWADLGDSQHGFSLINDSKFGYDDAENVLRLSLLRSPTSPDPNADRGHQHFSYALYPHGSDWKTAMTVRHGYEFNYPLTGMQVESHAGSMPASHSFVTVTPDNVVLTAMKKAEDSNALIFHLYEWAGKSADVAINLPKGATGAVETNLLEQAQGSPLTLKGDSVTIPIRPYEILAFQVDYPEKAN